MHQVYVRWLPLFTLSVALTAAADGAELNFYEQSNKQGCASIITERGQEECTRVQQAKNEACSVPVQCDLDAFDRLVVRYKEA